MSQPEGSPPGRMSRRGFLKGTTSLSVAASTLLTATKEGLQEAAGLPKAPCMKAGEVHEISMSLNGQETKAKVRTGHSLLETLRDQLDLTGTKLVCDHGTCGACTVLIDGAPVNSCLMLAVDAAGRRVETIEGLAKDSKLHPIQAAFIKEDALQCGFCTSGMIMSCKALLDRNQAPSRDEVKSALCGNICRCGTYFNIFRAVDSASAAMKGGK